MGPTAKRHRMNAAAARMLAGEWTAERERQLGEETRKLL